MNTKKMSFLTVSFLMFLIVINAVINTLSISLKQAKEKIAMTLRYEISPDNKVASYNYIEIKKEEPVKITEDLTYVEPEVVEVVKETTETLSYVGKMTGYGADCRGCSGVGTLSCKTLSGGYHSLSIDGEYYTDQTYGSVRIVAADLEKFPCGTIVKVSNGNLGEFNAIVLDTGASVKNASTTGLVWMDLAFKTESDPQIYSATSNNTTYVVKRLGW